MNNLKLSAIIAVILAATFFVSCSKDKNDDLSNEIELIVASKQHLVENQNALIVRALTINNGWFPCYSRIEGFEYEEGYEYRLKVRVITPPLESSKTQSYELIKELSKDKKTTIFQQNSYTISNNAHAEGAKLSPTDKATIEDKIKQSSPFNGTNSLTLEFTDFYYKEVPQSRDCTYRTNTGKSGRSNITTKEIDGEVVTIWTCNFDGVPVSYNYTRIGSPTSIPYLILDLTSVYKTDYPELELAQSGIGLKINL